ncbi:MAG: hypothetical protein AAFP19_00735 [Bacteroidota bacterium]
MKTLLYALFCCCLSTWATAQTASITGTIRCLDNTGQVDVNITLNSDLLSSPLTTTTDANGYYEFSDLPTGGDYEIVPEKELVNPLNGVSTFDLVRMSRIILGLDPIDPFLFLAADLNQSGSITTFDMVDGRKLILGLSNNLMLSWIYATPDFMLPSADFPQGQGSVGQLTISNLSADVDDADFNAIRPGDLNLSGDCNE